MQKVLRLLIVSVLLATSSVALSSTSASAASTITTCTDLSNQKIVVLKADKKSCKSFSPSAMWHLELGDNSDHSGAGFSTLRVCSSKNPYFTYQKISTDCPKFQVTTDYWRAVSAPQTPEPATATAQGYDSAVITLAKSETATKLDAPISFYLITDAKSGVTTKVLPGNLGRLYLSGLSSESTYTFTITAVSVDGISPASAISPIITTGALPVVIVAPVTAPLAAPAFTFSSASETKSAGSSITSYTISSTGGAIASYSISPAAPAGLTFSTSTGLLSGTPTSVASATAYTVTATNASGSAARTFTLTVTLAVYTVGQTGPGGGKIFYVASGFFTQVGASGSMCTTNCKYLEVAPNTWSGGSSDPAITWSTGANRTAEATGADGTAIGDGYQNSLDVVAQAGNLAASSTAVAARAYTPTVSTITFNDWFLPSKDELNELYLQKSTVGMPSVGIYWTSSESGASTASIQGFDNGFQYSLFNKNLDRYARPVRAFGP